jgi:hypothetical protein
LVLGEMKSSSGGCNIITYPYRMVPELRHKLTHPQEGDTE